ncbi:uncharacterized protein RAG0_06763 [Rhynchosporium agropyri]|uniref:Uncharacterized protein n=1 Tax=Rhynchosporium agropyri TaxID=914238 RepID=A0A1E1KIQ4_9HELO|nr:uncharacterized protein RAG0_06763 [Rhynchosporium agropyri]
MAWWLLRALIFWDEPGRESQFNSQVVLSDDQESRIQPSHAINLVIYLEVPTSNSASMKRMRTRYRISSALITSRGHPDEDVNKAWQILAGTGLPLVSYPPFNTGVVPRTPQSRYWIDRHAHNWRSIIVLLAILGSLKER